MQYVFLALPYVSQAYGAVLRAQCAVESGLNPAQGIVPRRSTGHTVVHQSAIKNELLHSPLIGAETYLLCGLKTFLWQQAAATTR
jgi:hypothetical protein